MVSGWLHDGDAWIHYGTGAMTQDTEKKIDINTLEVRIGMLRQWLNEDRIKDGDRFVTNEQIMTWLEPAIKKLMIDELRLVHNLEWLNNPSGSLAVLSDRIAELQSEGIEQ